MPNVIMPNVIMLNVVILNVVMLSILIVQNFKKNLKLLNYFHFQLIVLMRDLTIRPDFC
jgi:hypothetical protein